MISTDPRDSGVPHESYRNEQFDAIQRVLHLHSDGGGTIVIEAPPGIGKTTIPTALGSIDCVTVFTSSLFLLKQYEEYGFTAVRGRQWYFCVWQKKLDAWRKPYKPTAFDCHFSNMAKCPAASKCPYLLAKIKALTAQRTVCTYRYGAMSSSIARRHGFLVFDECDVSVNEIIANSEIEITQDEVSRFSFPPFPEVENGILEDKGTIMSWLWRCHLALPEQTQMLDADSTDKKRKKIQRAIEQIEYGDWFISVNGSFILKPLTAKTIAPKAYTNKQTLVLMSATVGNPTALTSQLGLEKYTHIEYAHPTPVTARPVFRMPGATRMGWSKSGIDDNKFRLQAIMLWSFMKNNIDPSWRGIILTSSKVKASLLYEMLNERLDDRTLITGPSARLIEQFKVDKRKGLVAVGYVQGWAHGVDLVGDIGRFSVMASVPFPSESDPYIRTLRLYNKDIYEYNVYSKVVQAINRVMRNERDGDDWMINIGVLADARAWSARAMKYYSSWFSDSIV